MSEVIELNSSEWAVVYDKPEVGKCSYGQESLMTLGNGYLGWRGAPVWSQFSKDHYPGLYVAGIFNKTTTEISGQDVINEDMVNLPNPQLMRFIIDGLPINFDTDNVIDRKSQIDFKLGRQIDKYTLRVDRGFVSIRTIKYVDPINFHILGFEGSFLATFDGKLVIESVVDGTVLNQNVHRYRDFDSKEFEVTEVSDHLLVAKTRSSKIEIALAAKTLVDEKEMDQVEGHTAQFVERAELTFSENKKVKFEKVIAVATSYETENPSQFVKDALEGQKLTDIQESSENYWKQVWEEGDICLESDNPELQQLIRMNIFHLRQAAQHQANQHLDASVGSRGLTGEGYRGHIFWDEIYLIPYYALNEPDTARDLLRYRIKRLEAAKLNAESEGEKGAMFPWQSGLEGDEQSQFIHLNTVNNEWEPDHSRLQRHINLAIVYNLWIYQQLTGDKSLLNEGGLELLLETTKFWLNKAELGENGRYHIDGVMGPDEYHEAYPEQKEAGICDNAYTNLMLTWSLNWLFTLPADDELDLASAARKAGFDNELFKKARELSKNLYLDIDKNGVIAQFAGYFYLKEVDFESYKRRYKDIHRIDRLMKSEGISPDEFKVAKQADTLMTVYNLGAKQVEKLVEQLGYNLPENWLQVNRDYYLSRTVHGSTISRPVFAAVDVALGNFNEALDLLATAIASDYRDIQSGTTAEGIHMAVMAETLSVIQKDFAGVDFSNGEFSIAPKMPKTWRRLAFSQKFRQVNIEIEITNQLIVLKTDKDIKIKVYGNEFALKAGILSTFAIKNRN